MAEPLTQEETQLLLEHLASKAPDQKCGACGAAEWHVVGVEIVPSGTAAGHVMIRAGRMLPMVTLVCANCFCLRHFAWLPIKTGVHFK